MDRKLIEERFWEFARMIQRDEFGFKDTLFCPEIAEKRLRALAKYSEKPGIDISLLVKWDTLGRGSYDYENEWFDVTLGAAFYILDAIRKAGHMDIFLKLLPDETDYFYDDYLPERCAYSEYSNELLGDVVKYLLDVRGTKELVSVERATARHFSEPFAAVVALMPDESIQVAVTAFKEKLMDMIDRYQRCEKFFEEESSRRIDEMDTEVKKQKGTYRGTADHSEKTLEDMGKLKDEIGHILDVANTFPFRFYRYITMNRRAITRDTGFRKITDIVKGFTVDDPYAICFGLYYLIEYGDDDPWLLTPGACLIQATTWKLPWTYDILCPEEDYVENDGPIPYTVNNWTTQAAPEETLDFFNKRHKGKNYAQIIYDLTGCIPPIGKHPFEKDRLRLIEEGMDKECARRIIDYAELLFLREYQVEPRRYSFVTDEFLTGFEQQSIKEANRRQSREKIETGDEESEEESSPEEQYKKALEKADKEIKGLRDMLHAERRDASKEYAKLEQELKVLRMEHRELADLRELVFNRENEVDEKARQKIDYPYTVRKNTVVFGGHDSFLRAIKPMLNNVKFMELEQYGFDPNIVRNADVVWVQTNCISHSQYKNIVKIVRTAGVQLRYFGYASAEKCAEQLVLEDMRD